MTKNICGILFYVIHNCPIYNHTCDCSPFRFAPTGNPCDTSWRRPVAYFKDKGMLFCYGGHCRCCFHTF